MALKAQLAFEESRRDAEFRVRRSWFSGCSIWANWWVAQFHQWQWLVGKVAVHGCRRAEDGRVEEGVGASKSSLQSVPAAKGSASSCWPAKP